MWSVSVAALPMRAEPDDRSEQVSEALFGEEARVREFRRQWARIETPDDYTGWVRRSGLVDEAQTGETVGRYRVSSPASELESGPGWIPLGCVVAGELEGERFRVRLPGGGDALGSAADFEPFGRPLPLEPTGLVATARLYLGAPYVWGGRTPKGTDCSGFVQRVYQIHGVSMPRDAYLQAAWPRLLEVERSELRAGDLVFFRGQRDPRNRGVTHVGMMVDGASMIHASGALGVAETPLASSPFDRQYVCARRWDDS